MKLLLAFWLLTLGACFAFVKLVPWGPVILTVSGERGWGVHMGDLITLCPLTAMTCYTIWHFKQTA